jgi:hypothetical protein
VGFKYIYTRITRIFKHTVSIFIFIALNVIMFHLKIIVNPILHIQYRNAVFIVRIMVLNATFNNISVISQKNTL